MPILVYLTLLAWALLEAGLLVRDQVRGKGGTARDQGTRRLSMIGWLVAFIVASSIAHHSAGHSGWAFGSGPAGWAFGTGPAGWAFGTGRSGWTIGAGHLLIGLLLMWIGLAIRIWSVLTLGASFRTTVEVDADQQVVDKGPYRWARHPSYTGMLTIALGCGVALGNWLSLAILVVIPLATMLRRISVEEATLVDVLGQPYLEYQRRTKRLVPGLW